MLDSYRNVLSRPGTLRFSSAALVARLPIAMVSLGIVLLVERATGSYGVAGTVSAVYVLAQAAVAVLHGRLLDVRGQSLVLPWAISLFAAALSAMVWSVERGWPLVVTYVLAALAGATLPQVGASVRTRWSHVLQGRAREVQSAYALESVLDELVFMAGPVLVTLLATAWHPAAGLGVAVVAGLVGTLGYAVQRDTEPPPRRRTGTSKVRDPMPWLVVLPLALVSLAQGTLFGVAEVATVAFADEQGREGAGGILLACWALGSLTAGLATGAIAWRRGPAVRVRVGMVALTVAMIAPAWVGDLVSMGLVLVVGGVAIAPTLIATLTLVETTVPHSRLTEGMAILHTGLIAGVAPGATIGGFVVDAHGANAAYLVAVAAGAIGVLAAQATRLVREEPERPAAATAPQ